MTRWGPARALRGDSSDRERRIAFVCPSASAVDPLVMIRRNGQPPVAQGAPPLAKATPASPIVAVPVRVALLSDSALFRSGLHPLLGTDPSFRVVAELTAPPIRDRLRSSLPHILLVDAQTEGALEICRELRLNGVRPWVILAGAARDERWAV